MVKCCKEIAARKNMLRKETEYLNALEARYTLAVTCPSDTHGWLGPSQDVRLCPLPTSSFSKDLHDGGRTWGCGKDQRWWPSAAQILSAQHQHHAAIIPVPPHFHVLRSFWNGKTSYCVGLQQAADAVGLLRLRSFPHTREFFRRVGILQNEKLVWAKVEEYFLDLAVVDAEQQDCTCWLYRETSECPHLLSVLHADNIIQKKKVAKPAKTKQGRGRPVGWQNPQELSDDAACLIFMSFAHKILWGS